MENYNTNVTTWVKMYKVWTGVDLKSLLSKRVANLGYATYILGHLGKKMGTTDSEIHRWKHGKKGPTDRLRVIVRLRRGIWCCYADRFSEVHEHSLNT